jgi:kinetochore protein Spc24
MRTPAAVCRHQLSLYAHVSKITWQFEAPARVAGTVSNPLRAFDFDPQATPNFEIVNTLWELMGTDS